MSASTTENAGTSRPPHPVPRKTGLVRLSRNTTQTLIDDRLFKATPTSNSCDADSKLPATMCSGNGENKKSMAVNVRDQASRDVKIDDTEFSGTLQMPTLDPDTGPTAGKPTGMVCDSIVRAYNSCNDIELLKKELNEVIQKNNQWQVYDSQREYYVKSFHQKYYELHCHYQELSATHHRITSNPSSLSEAQRQYYDNLLIQARQERKSYQEEIDKLKEEMHDMKMRLVNKFEQLKDQANHWKALYENEIEKRNQSNSSVLKHSSKISTADKENWDRISSLQREMEIHRKDFSLEKNKRESIERQLESLREQLHHRKTPEKQCKVKTSHAPKESVDPTLDTSRFDIPANHKQTSKGKVHAIKNNRRSHPVESTHVTLRKTRTPNIRDRRTLGNDSLNRTVSDFGRHNDSDLSCPNCGKVYSIGEHERLLSHIDLCI